MKQLKKTSSFDVRKGETMLASQVLLELEKATEEVWARSREADVMMPRAQIGQLEHLRQHMSSKISLQPGRASEDDSVVNL